MRILSKGSAPKVHRKAIEAFVQGHYKTAGQEWSQLLEKNPYDFIALKGLGFLYFLEGQYREARSYFSDAAGINANDPEIYNVLALIAIHEGQVDYGIDILLDALDRVDSPLLKNTLEKVRKIGNPDLAKNIPLMPLLQITLPGSGFSLKKWFNSTADRLGVHLIWIGAALMIGLAILFYPEIRNAALSANLINRANALSPATQVSIKGITDIVNARENFRIVLSEQVIIRKFEDLKAAISAKRYNKARILANELLASNAALAVKERVGILESFIPDPDPDSIDYVPSYAEIAVAPAVYEGVMLRWQGTVANLHHQGRKKTTFDLLVNFLDQGLVEGIALVEAAGFHELNNSAKITVIGPLQGLTKDNRVIIKAERLLPY